MTPPSESPDSPETPGGPAATGPVPLLLCDVEALAAQSPAPAGALWKLTESGRQLDANLVHLPPGERVASHREPDLDVLLLVVAGAGTLTTPAGGRPLAQGALVWLPHGSPRGIDAGRDGLSYLTVHRRRPGMRIGRAAPDTFPGAVRDA